ncbi:hypothetical protein ABZ135_25600 [Streptomyces sp. NPDC006339]|uniref:hypothetical protein n=1 Tax=Streptomyces sp. NPDC006339 TaxID=3156755 RepID=UPI0033B4F07E
MSPVTPVTPDARDPRGTVTLPVGDDVADLADARGVSVEELVGEAVARYVSLEATLVRHEAQRLALRHLPLLKRLGA